MGDVDVIEVRVSAVEKAIAVEIEKRERSDKYRHNMAEDAQARFAEIKSDLGGMRAGFIQHLEDDKQLYALLSKMGDRIQTIERLVWIAAGGVAVIGGVIYIFASQFLRLLAK